MCTRVYTRLRGAREIRFLSPEDITFSETSCKTTTHLCLDTGASEVFDALSTVVSPAVSADARRAATASLSAWERTVAPGFVGALTQLAGQPVRSPHVCALSAHLACMLLRGRLEGARVCSCFRGLNDKLYGCESLIASAPTPQDVAEDARLLAVMALKNVVGASWRKTLSTREWLRVPEAERAAARATALHLLLHHPSRRLAAQACLLVANVARFDAPRRWDNLLPELLAAARNPSGATAEEHHVRQCRALKALKHVCNALAGTRVAAGQAALAADQQATQEAMSYVLPPIAADWRINAHKWSSSGAGDAAVPALELAAAGAAALGPMLRLVKDLDAPPEFATGCIEPLFTTFHDVLVAGSAPGSSAPGGGAAKLFRRVAAAVGSAQDSHPLAFARYLSPFVRVMATAVLSLPHDALVEDPQRAQALTAFLANVLLCPQYKPPKRRGQAASPRHPESPPPLVAPDEYAPLGSNSAAHVNDTAQAAARNAATQAAAAAIAPLLDGDAFVRALIERYLCPTPAELEEWRQDPRALLQHADGEPLVTAGVMDAAIGGGSADGSGDSARPCAETVLLCLLLRDRTTVTSTVLGLATQAQALSAADTGNDSEQELRNALFRDGVYRAIGVMAPELPHAAVDVPAWARAELFPLLAVHASCVDAAARGETGTAAAKAAASVSRRLLAARALWLLGRFAEDMVMGREQQSGDGSMMSEQQRQQRLEAGMALAHDAACACLPHLRVEDPLLALHAAAALRQLAVCVANAASGAVVESARNALATGAAERTSTTGLEVNRAAHSAAATAVAAWGLPALSRCLALLPAVVGDPDTAAGVLRLCGLLIDTLGRRVLAPHAGTLAAALPAVWSATDVQGGGTPGASARVHAALLSTLAHLVRITGTAALAAAPAAPTSASLTQPAVGGVLFPLLAYATDPANASSDALMDDGIALWVAALRCCPPGPLHPAMDALTPRLFDLLHADPRSSLILVCQGYILVGAAPWLAAHAQQIANVLAPPLLSTEPGAETALLAACAGLDMAVQLQPGAMLPTLAPHATSICDRLALMNGGNGGAAQHDDDAAALLPTAMAGKAYSTLLSRISLASPDAVRQLMAGRPPCRAADTISVCCELMCLRAMDELLGAAGVPVGGLGGRGRPAMGGGTAPSSQQEDRAVVAAAMCDILRDAAAQPGAGADACRWNPSAVSGDSAPAPLPEMASAPGAMLTRVGPVVALLLVALTDVARLTGDETGQGCLPVAVPNNPRAVLQDAGLTPPSSPMAGANATPITVDDPDEEQVPNLVDAQAWRLAAHDPARTVPLMQRGRAFIAAVRAACGPAWVHAALEAEERLRDARGLRATLLTSLLA